MKIASLHVERFRQFRNTTFHFGTTSLLVGPNNSGKTTVLHAIRAFFSLMHGYVQVAGSPPTTSYHKRFLSGPSEILPAPDLREIWSGQDVGKKPVKITIAFDDGAAYSLVLRHQFGQIHVSAEDLPAGLTTTQINRHLASQVAFIPGLVGVLVEEPFATAARRTSLASQGRYSGIFRSSLLQLRERDAAALQKVNDWIRELFDVEVTKIAFDMESDEFVTIRYRQRDNDYDVVSSGSGLQQVIQVLTYLYLAKPKILLIDEPDAHLQSKLQARLGDLLRRVAGDLDAQLFISTHSIDLIDTFSADNVLVVDAEQKDVRPIGSNVDLVGTLVDAGIVDVSSLSRLLSSRRLVVVEDTDKTVLKAIDKALGNLLFSSKSPSYVLSANGVGNFRAVARLGEILSSLASQQFEMIFIQDRDGLPDSFVDPLRNSQQGQGVSVHLTARHEIESYLLEPSLLVDGAKAKDWNLLPADAERAITAAATGLKAEARRITRKTTLDVNRHLLREARYEEADAEREEDKWFDDLDTGSVTTVQAVFPGKELLEETLKVLNRTAPDGKHLTKGLLVACLRREHVAADMVTLIEELGGAPARPQQSTVYSPSTPSAPPKKTGSARRRPNSARK